MKATRREFLAASGTLAFAGAAGAFPVPLRQAPLAPSPFRAPSDAMPPLPDGAFYRLGSRRFRTSKSISRIQFSPTGKVLVAADRDEIRGWDVATAKPVFSMPYPLNVNLNSGRITNRDTIVTLGRIENATNYEIHHYAFATGRSETRAVTNLTNIDAASFSADGSRVAAIQAGRLHVFDGMQTQELWVAGMGSSERGVSEILFVDGDRTLAANTADGLRLYDADTGKERNPLKLAPREKKGLRRVPPAVDSLTTSPSGEWLAGTGGTDRKSIFVWNIPANELRLTLEEKTPATLIGFSPDGQTLYVNREGTVVALAVATGKVIRTLDVSGNHSPILSPDGSVLAMDSNDAIILFDAVTGQPLPQSADPPGLPSKLHYAGASKLVGLFPEFGGWVAWDLNTGTTRLLRPKSLGDGVPIGISNDERLAVVSAKDALRRLDFVGESEREALANESNRSTPLAEVSLDGSRIVAADESGLKVWDAKTGKLTRITSVSAASDGPDHLAISHDGEIAVIASQIADPGHGVQHSVEVYSLRAQRVVHSFQAKHINGFALSPDGSRLAINSNFYENRARDYAERQTLIVHDARNGQVLLTLPRDGARAFAFSHCNRLLAVAVNEHDLDVWELAAGGQRLKLRLPGEASAIAFAPDGTSLAVAGSGGPVLLWDLRGLHRP
jgi:WD40 repeat protein